MRHSSTAAVLAAVALTIAGCDSGGGSAAADPSPPSSPSPQCSEETTYDYDSEAAGEPTPLDAFELALTISAPPTLDDDQITAMREQLAQIPDDEDAGIVVVGAEGATVTLRPSTGGGWALSETTILADC